MGSSDAGNSSPSLSSRNSLGRTGGFILSLTLPPRGLLYDVGFGTLVVGWKTSQSRRADFINQRPTARGLTGSYEAVPASRRSPSLSSISTSGV